MEQLMSMATNTLVVEKYWALLRDVYLHMKRHPGGFTVQWDRLDYVSVLTFVINGRPLKVLYINGYS